MAFDITKAAKLASQKTNLEPQMVLEIDGVETRFGVRVIQKSTRFDDPDIYFDDPGLLFDGKTPLDDQASIISFSEGTATSIQQQLDPSKGAGSSVSSLQIALVDIDKIATKLVSPGVVVDDVLGRRARVYTGLQDTAFPEDYVTIFRGVIDDIQSGASAVTLTLSSPDQKKRQTLFTKQTVTVAAVSGSDLTFSTADAAKIYYDKGDPDGSLSTYLKYGDEYILVSYNYSTPNTFTIQARAQLGSSMNPDTIVAGKEFEPAYMLEGNVMDLALKLMLSDQDRSPYLDEMPVSSVIDVEGAIYPNSIFFRGVNMVERYGISVKDAVTLSGPVNDWKFMGYESWAAIEDISVREDGTLLTLQSDVPFTYVVEPDCQSTARFYSFYNVLGVGLGMKPDEVDIDQHLYLKKTFLSSFSMRFFLDDEENMREFIEQELYLPAGAFSIPRKSKASVGLHTGPIPGANAAVITRADVPNPSKLKIRRSLANNFYNTIIYKFDQEIGKSGDDSWRAGLIEISQDSLDRVQVGNRSQVIESRGMRTDLNAKNLARQAAQRRLNRYKFGAEYIENFPLTFKKGFNLEIGDVFLLVPDGLGLINTKTGSRQAEPKLYEIINKTLDFKTGAVMLSIIDTNYATQKRYGLISPSSRIRTGISNTRFVIEQALPSQFGSAEYLKWARFVQSGNTIGVMIRSADFTTRFAQTQLKSVIGNEIEVTTDLGFTPEGGDWMEFARYDFSGTTDIQKQLYAYMKDTDFADGGNQYVML